MCCLLFALEVELPLSMCYRRSHTKGAVKQRFAMIFASIYDRQTAISRFNEMLPGFDRIPALFMAFERLENANTRRSSGRCFGGRSSIQTDWSLVRLHCGAAANVSPRFGYSRWSHVIRAVDAASYLTFIRKPLKLFGPREWMSKLKRGAFFFMRKKPISIVH